MWSYSGNIKLRANTAQQIRGVTKMRKYKITFLTSHIEIEIDELTVEAKSKEEAEEKALARFRVAYNYYSEWEYKWIAEELA